MNRTVWISALVGVMVLSARSSLCLGHGVGTLSGTVYDPSGVVIPRSVIILYWNPPGNLVSWNGVPKLPNKGPRKKGLVVIADGNGQFSVKLFAGWWDVFVHADGLHPICQFVRVEAGKTQTLQLKFAPWPMIE